MFDDLPSDLDQLRTLRIWHALWVQRIDAKAAAIRQRQAEEEYGRRNRPAPPEWIVELGIGAGRPPLQVHAGDCHMAGKRHRPVDRDEARRLLTQGLKACIHCQPDVLLHIIDLSRAAGPRPRTPTRSGRATPGLPSGARCLSGAGCRPRPTGAPKPVLGGVTLEQAPPKGCRGFRPEAATPRALGACRPTRSALPHQQMHQCHHPDAHQEGGAEGGMLEGDVYGAASDECE
ncbi:DUF6233 domain-containing protein [Streptomyces violaceoruber]|uniref:DUF6233 domain-containing protein n=1 Tax=Streptomyces violaceoruber TaxID=1935 RepID=UPI00403C9EBF